MQTGTSTSFRSFVGILFFWFSLCIPAASANEKVTIGAILPLSGDAASLGAAVKNGITLGYESLEPDIKNRIELVFEDDALQAKNTISAFNRLVSLKDVDVVIGVASSTSLSIAPLAEKARVPLIAIASDAQIVRDRKYVVNLWVTPEVEAKVAVPEIIRRGYKKIARISSVQQGVDAINTALNTELKGAQLVAQGKESEASRIEIVLDEQYPLENKDFKPFINKLQQKNDVDAVLVVLLPGQAGIFTKQLRQYGNNLPIFSFEMFEDAAELKASDGAMVGAWYVNAADSGDTFLNLLAQKFPGSSAFGAANGHDAVKLIAEAISKSSLADKSSSEAINHHLHTVKNFSGALGTFSASDDNRFDLPAAVKIVTADGFMTLSPGT